MASKNKNTLFRGYFSKFYGSTNHKKVKLPEAFYPFIEYIKENFSEVYEFLDNAYKSINIEEVDE